MKRKLYRIVRGADVGMPTANFLVVDQNNNRVGIGALPQLGFPTWKLARQWKLQLEGMLNQP